MVLLYTGGSASILELFSGGSVCMESVEQQGFDSCLSRFDMMPWPPPRPQGCVLIYSRVLLAAWRMLSPFVDVVSVTLLSLYRFGLRDGCLLPRNIYVSAPYVCYEGECYLMIKLLLAVFSS